MDFFGIGPGELLLILIIALVVFGPGKLPEMGRTLGQAIRGFRKATSELTTEITKETEAEEGQRRRSTAEEAPGERKEPE